MPSDLNPRSLDPSGYVSEWDLGLVAPGDSIVRSAAVQVASPDGQRLTLPAFADGERWRARLATTPGTWRWQTTNGDSGTLEAPPVSSKWPLAPLRPSENRRYLTSAGEPFFFFGDTAWSIVWKGRLEEWVVYLDRRAAQGFSVLQVNLLPWLWEATDVEGNRPFHTGDPSRPNPAYFRRYDQFLAMAAERGLRVCLMLIWGGPRPQLPAVNFSTDQAVAFARYAVARFGAFPMLWSLSGDAEYVEELEKWDAVGAAVEEIDAYTHPTTNHLPPSMNWYALHHRAPWHDFHMLQTGHRRGAIAELADLPAYYSSLDPTKAVVNGEPWYEAHPAMDQPGTYGPVFTPDVVRYAFWVSVLSGATMGHTYGGQGIWNWKRPGDSEEHLAGPQIGPPWTAALDHPGAAQCALGVELLKSLPWWQFRPAPERVQIDPPPLVTRRAFCAIAEGRAWVVYLPAGAGQLTLKGVTPDDWRARWFDPRTGESRDLGEVKSDGSRKWRAPAAPTPDDWTFVLERANL